MTSRKTSKLILCMGKDPTEASWKNLWNDSKCSASFSSATTELTMLAISAPFVVSNSSMSSMSSSAEKKSWLDSSYRLSFFNGLLTSQYLTTIIVFKSLAIHKNVSLLPKAACSAGKNLHSLGRYVKFTLLSLNILNKTFIGTSRCDCKIMWWMIY